MNKFKRVLVSNPNFRFGTQHLLTLADQIVYLCDSPIFDDMIDDQDAIDKFETSVMDKLRDFDPRTDVLSFYGDVLIFAMALWEISQMELDCPVSIARWSAKAERYLVKQLEV